MISRVGPGCCCLEGGVGLGKSGVLCLVFIGVLVRHQNFVGGYVVFII